LKNKIFNHDRFNTWQACQKKYYYKYVKELNLPEFENVYRLGQSFHALMDYHLRGLNTELLLRHADSDVVNIWNKIKTHPILAKKVIKTEWGFNTRLGDTAYWLEGRVDAIFYDETTNKYIIADWKTGIIPKNIDTNFQHKIYLYAFYRSRKDLNLDMSPKNLCFQYFKIDSQNIEIKEINFSEEKLQEYEENLIKITRNIEKTFDFSLQDICPIKFCHYNNLCEIIKN